MRIEAPRDLRFIKYGKLNMIVLRNGKEVEKVDVSTQAFLTDPRCVRSQGVMLDVVTFQPNCVFKVTLDFSSQQTCMDNSAREVTDWVLVSCMGTAAHYNRVEERLILQQCFVCTQSNIEQLATPFQIILAFDEDEWIVEKIWR